MPPRKHRTPRHPDDQMRLFDEVDAVLTAAAGRLAAETPAEPTVEVLALDLLYAQARHRDLVREFYGDEATRQAASRAGRLHREAKAGLETAVAALRQAEATGDHATAALLRVAVSEHVQVVRHTQAHRREVVDVWLMQSLGVVEYRRWLETKVAQREALDRSQADIAARTRTLAARLEVDQPTYLPTLEADADDRRRREWRHQAVEVAVYRARLRVDDPTHPLGRRPLDLAQAAEYDRQARTLGLVTDDRDRPRQVTIER